MLSARLKIGGGLVAVGLAWYAFRPELLFVNRAVNEELPKARAAILAEGEFRGLAHETTGRASVHQLAGGRRVLRLTGFSTSNGPAVRVYLVAAADAAEGATVKRAGFIDLGALKGNRGDQNYDLPPEADLAKHRSVNIWCRRFAVNFGTAQLKAP